MTYPHFFERILLVIQELGLSVQSGMVVFGVAFAFCLLIVIGRPFHLRHTTRAGDLGAVQAAHKRPTPRIGGVAVLVAVVIVAATQVGEFSAMRVAFLLSVVPVFAAGLAEDLGYGASPRLRLLAALVSSAIAVAGLGIWIDRLNVPGLDTLLGLWPLGIGFTLLCSAGFAHAFNLIDGVNGFAASMGSLIALALGMIAYNAGLPGVAQFAFLLVPALLGFLVFNWPFGAVFLGDAGAYSLGHVFAWVAIVVAARAPDVSAFALALVLFWPAADTVFAIVRRRRAGRSPFLPDRLHFHQLVMRGLELAYLGRARRHVSNPATTAVLLPFVAAPILTGVILWDRPGLASLAMALFLLLFVASYAYGVRFAQAQARRVSGDRAGSRLDRTGAFEVAARSPLSGVFVADGVALDVAIVRKPGDAAWRLSTRDRSGEEVQWGAAFASDSAAWESFISVLKSETMQALAGPGRRRVR